MIDLKEFNLIYLRKDDRRKCLVKFVTKYDSVIIDSVTGRVERLTSYYLKKLYLPDLVTNKRNRKRGFAFMNFGRKRVS